jgi:transposase
MNPPKSSVFVGIDWGSRSHAVCVWTPTHGHEASTLPHSPEELKAWALGLQKKFPTQDIYVAWEGNRGPLLFALESFPWLKLHPVNPRASGAYRTALFPSGSKSDLTDARLICDFLRNHLDQIRPHTPLDVKSLRLSSLVQARRTFVDDRTRLANRLRALLKGHFPQVLDWFPTLTSSLLAEFLLRWPSLDQLKRSRKSTILNWLYAHHVRKGGLLTKMPDEVATAEPLHEQDVLLSVNARMIKGICTQLKNLNQTIADFDKEIAKAANEHPDVSLFRDLPGAGPQLQPRLLAAFGTQRDRYPTAGVLQQLAGIAPVKEESGSSCWIHYRWSANKFLRQTFHEFALHSIVKSSWARAYYDAAIARGKSHHAAVRALAFKWIRILHKCWLTHTPYNEEAYLIHLAKKGSPYALQKAA